VVGVLDEVKEVVRGFFEEVFEAVSYVVANSNKYSPLWNSEERLKSGVGTAMEVL